MANPEKDNFQVDPEMSKKMKNIAKEMRHNPLLRITGSVIYAITMVYFLSSTPEGRRQLKNPEFRRTLIDKEKRTGLLEDTIYHPTYTTQMTRVRHLLNLKPNLEGGFRMISGVQRNFTQKKCHK